MKNTPDPNDTVLLIGDDFEHQDSSITEQSFKKQATIVRAVIATCRGRLGYREI